VSLTELEVVERQAAGFCEVLARFRGGLPQGVFGSFTLNQYRQVNLLKKNIAFSLIVGSAFLLVGCQPDSDARRRDADHFRSPAKHYGPKTDVVQCNRDNADARVSREVVRRYCECMDARMGEHNHRSISAWEHSHPRAVAECERKSGWR
jgi:hypothetical protein